MTAVILTEVLDSIPFAERGLLLLRHYQAAMGEHLEGRLVIPSFPTLPIQTTIHKTLQYFLQTMHRKCTAPLGKPSHTSAAQGKHKPIRDSWLSYKNNINFS